MENLRRVPSVSENLRTNKLISCKCLTYRELVVLEFSWMKGSWSEVVSYQHWEVFSKGMNR